MNDIRKRTHGEPSSPPRFDHLAAWAGFCPSSPPRFDHLAAWAGFLPAKLTRVALYSLTMMYAVVFGFETYGDIKRLGVSNE